MQSGALTSQFDVGLLAWYTFALFFIGLVVYLRREDKREGYPLVAEGPGKPAFDLFPLPPPKKTFLLADGSTVTVPREEVERTGGLRQLRGPTEGTPFVPTGNPLRDAVGPASYAQRKDRPDVDWEGHARIVPLRVATGFSLEPSDPDPRGYEVVATDRKPAGTVKEVWIDRAEPQVYYYEVSVASGGTVLLPARLSVVDPDTRRINVASVTAAQFADAPRLKNPDQVTLLEEDKISGYFAGGHLYATPERSEPLI